MHLQTDVKKEAWVDPQDAFHNYRLLTAGRECFVVSCAWLISMMLHVLRRDSSARTDHSILKRLLRWTVLSLPVSHIWSWQLSVQLVQETSRTHFLSAPHCRLCR